MDTMADADAPKTTGVAVLDKLAALEVARKVDRDKKREEMKELADPKESIEAFLSAFRSEETAVAAELDAMVQAGPQEDTKATQSALDQLSARLLALESKMATASYYLPTYDQKQCTARIAALRQSIDNAQGTLIPKRKFAFSKKVSRVKGAEAAAAAAVGDAAQPAPTPEGGGGTAAAQEAPTAAPSTSGAAAVSEHDMQLVQSGRGVLGARGQVIRRSADELCGGSFVLIDLEDCTVHLDGQLAALRILNVRNTTVVTGPVTGSTFVDHATAGCRLHIASYQVRIHSSSDTHFYLRARSKPIIEHTCGVSFAPYAAGEGRPALAELLAAHMLGDDMGMWRQVDDFGWIKAAQSPNWAVLPEEQRLPPPQ